MRPYTLDHTRQNNATTKKPNNAKTSPDKNVRCSHPLCNTQHTTTPRTTTATTTPPPTKDCVRPARPGAAPRTHPHRCLLRTQQHAKLPVTPQPPHIRTNSRSVPPSHTHTPPITTTSRAPDQAWNQMKGEQPTPHRKPASPPPTRWAP